MTFAVNRETVGFQSDVRQLLHLVVHSLYGNREVFLRELVSNAADALDKLRFLALSDDALYEGEPQLRIQVDYSAELGTITVRDNGIGMTRQEVIDNIGTLARSGTREFLQSLSGEAHSDAGLIGQFGVGFYSAFIVAERVVLSTRRAGAGEDEGVRWESDGTGEYTVQNLKRKARGTEIVLHLREQAREFLDGHRLREIVRRYSEHLPFPIEMPCEGEGATGWETVNQATALWTRPKAEIEAREYREFYKFIAHDTQDPLAWVHSKVEGKLEYTSVFYVPAHAPFDLWAPDGRHGVKLYVRRVFIMDGAEQLLPRYLRFIRGVVDSDDLPLNVSREILQHSKAIESIRSASVKRILGLLEELASDRADDYATFWANFGRVLKEGVIEDPANRERIAALARFATTRADKPDNDASLADYVARMLPGQKHIYYVIADSFEKARSSPHLEVFRERGCEVLLLSDAVDEWMVAHLGEFDGRELRSVARGELDAGEIGGAGDDDAGDATGEAEALAKRLRDALQDRVKAVRVSRRLTSSPACLVADEQDMGAHLQRLLRAAGQAVEAGRPILEINPAHPFVRRLGAENGERFSDRAQLLFEQAVLSEGGQLEDPAAFVQRMNRMFVELDAGPAGQT